ncbi:type II toxin-antitoxin system VapC family toxin [Amycolatopsis alkalitolerans]|uniref:Type II toxin-antitoxin system VapC family toxin n=1 Tax=Amycolatopsis alkalitolerans TaxID=2547244 RepID=A0A5C4M3N8_9PSEU|nr:type II toxin-antitoxin system VapC family toxin [Amycolatopsis alkalitolerans]TNC27686.1 type II toxin-antitoxin system VapC family toxin [Amycolatopsis alkalitolerans]
MNAPHLVDAEVGDVLRRMVPHGRLRAETAETALMSLNSLVDARYAHVGALSRDAWDLRDRVRFYDALYVALAARLELPLLTRRRDARQGAGPAV